MAIEGPARKLSTAAQGCAGEGGGEQKVGGIERSWMQNTNALKTTVSGHSVQRAATGSPAETTRGFARITIASVFASLLHCADLRPGAGTS